MLFKKKKKKKGVQDCNKKISCFCVHDTKYIKLFTVADEEALTIARCCYIFLKDGPQGYCGFATDSGSCFTSDVLAQVNQWLPQLATGQSKIFHVS